MIGKVQKIREKVERLKSQLLRGACSSQIAMETRCKEEAYNEVLAILDTTQEEPVSIWHDASEEPNDKSSCLIHYIVGGKVLYRDIFPVLYNKKAREFVSEPYPHPTGYKVEQSSLEGGVVAEVHKNMRDRFPFSDIYKWAYIDDIIKLSNVERTGKNWKEEPVNRDRFAFKALPRLLEMIEPTDRAKTYIAKLADALEKEGYTTDAKIVRESIKIMNGEKVAMATMDEEPVSEDLVDATNNYVLNVRKGYPRVMDETDRYICNAFKAGAQWKEDQLEKNRLAACDAQTNKDAEIERDFVMGIIEKEHRQPTFDDAIKYGMRLQKKQMLEKAVMTAFNVSLPCGVYDRLKAKGCKEGDKLLIIIKED